MSNNTLFKKINVFVAKENDKYQVWIWVNGMKAKLESVNGGFSTSEAALPYGKMLADGLSIPFTGLI
jgi:hypothetical protein